jgi:DNA-binding transcriptional regulator of glucitol operon
MIWNIVIAAGIIWIIMSFFNFLQTVQIRNIYKKLEKQGHVYFGRDAGLLRTRAMLFAAADENGIVTEAIKMKTVPVFVISKTMPFPEFGGLDLGHLDIVTLHADLRMKLAAINLLKNYESAKGKAERQKAKAPRLKSGGAR